MTDVGALTHVPAREIGRAGLGAAGSSHRRQSRSDCKSPMSLYAAFATFGAWIAL